MWPAALVTAAAASFGRLFVAGILPSFILVSTIWITSRKHAFSPKVHDLTLNDLLPHSVQMDSTDVLVFLLVVSVVTAVLRNVQISAVRLLEGYWGARGPALGLFARRAHRHTQLRQRAQDRLVQGEKLPEGLAVPMNAAVDAMDAAAIFCLTFACSAVITGVAFGNDTALLWVPILFAVLSLACCRGSIISATILRSYQFAAFDLYRFEMMKQMSLPLPDTPEQEVELAARVSALFASRTSGDVSHQLHGMRYAHAAPPGRRERMLARLRRHQRSTTTVPAVPAQLSVRRGLWVRPCPVCRSRPGAGNRAHSR
ncbi:hypothetical protein [Actinoplanes sp. N902-109]|uniref:hypothetical protein n=1 Tax=Actinoplanes sp. (strain N902-109) TaxID=649831 RepID=UPI0003293645|nr:hypothetical protein [Actinoplanes sp. N902-109]AGL17385.1 hypothetical protein L083_3875 [Actinoplanes sp. N902-109]